MHKSRFAFFSFLIILLISALFSACGGSGGSASIQTNSSYDSQYRDQTRASGMAGGEAAPAMDEAVEGSPFYMTKEESGFGMQDGPLAQPGNDNISSTIQNWLTPSAWAQDSSSTGEYIVRTGNIEMEIEDYDKSSADVQTIAIRHTAIITDSQMQKYGDDMRVGWITLRVPSASFQQCFDDLKAIGDVKVQSVSSEDVSTEYIAGVSRMEALRAEHETLQGMLEDAREVQRTRGLGEAYSVLLETQSRLSEVTAELQNVENRVSSMKDRIQRSTITVNLSERPLAPPPDEFSWGFGSTFENAKKDLMAGVAYTVNGIIYFLVNGLVWWIIWIGIIWLAWKLLGRRIFRMVTGQYKKEQAAGKLPAAK